MEWNAQHSPSYVSHVAICGESDNEGISGICAEEGTKEDLGIILLFNAPQEETGRQDIKWDVHSSSSPY